MGRKRRQRSHLVLAAAPLPPVPLPPIEVFTGPYFFLSNFAESPVEFDGVIYPTVEHAFAAAKTLESAERERIRLAARAG
jgi:hypothetical protein